MLLFVGLGNPGPEYVATRHNIGFIALQAIADFWGIKPWRRRFHGVFVDGLIHNERVGLLLPETFMNDSGRSVVEAAHSFGLDQFQIIIFHDDIELSPGDIRVKVGGGMAGHQGHQCFSSRLCASQIF
jgi:PTH1 family peptidyl-tRNA hydrolase